LPKYITEYVKEHYDVIKVRKEVAERLREFAKEMGLTISDAISYLLPNIQDGAGDVVDQVASEVASYVLSNYRGEDVKLLAYPGGDFRIFDELNRIFMASKANVFVEPFGGSCWCSLNVSRAKFKVIVCNDIDQDLINFYRLVRDRPCELAKRLAILPISRELRKIAIEILRDGSADPITKAVLFFYVARTSFSGGAGRKPGFGSSKTVNRAKTYSCAVASIAEYAKRFRDVVLECKDYRDIIKQYDSESTLFYLDPPYVGRDVDHYRYGFTTVDLRNMARLLKNVKGFWVLKVTEDNYALIKDVLPPHSLEEIKTAMSISMAKGEKRPVLRYLVAHNVKIPRTVPLFRQ